MAVQAQFEGYPLTPYVAEEQMRALKDYGRNATLLSAAAVTPGANDAFAWQQYDYCTAQSELTCNNGGVEAVPVPTSSRKRGRDDDDDLLHYYAPFLPLPAAVRVRPHFVMPASTSGRPADVPSADAQACDLWRDHDAEVDALVRAECDRLRAGLELARKRQRHALVRAAVSGLAQRAREAEAQLDAARRRAAELEDRVRHAAAEAQAWCGVARGNEAVAAGLRATLDALLLRSVSVSSGCDVGAEGFGESEPEDAQSSCCYVEEQAPDTAAAATGSSPPAKRACRSCGAGEASVLVLPCRHLCLCKACEPRMDACPVCAGAKNAAINIAPK